LALHPSPRTSSHLSLKSRNNQHAYAEVRVAQTAFTSSSVVLQPARVNQTRVAAKQTVLYFQ